MSDEEDQTDNDNEEVLKDEEIDALIGDEGEQAPASDGTPVSFDFTAQDKIVRGRMPTLEMIGDRFIRNFKLSLYHRMRKTAEISSEPIKIIKFNEFVNTFGKPTSFNIVQVEPLRGNALFVMDGAFVFSLVETYFGGDGKIQKEVEEREFTPSETRIGKKFLDIIFEDLTDAWHPIYPVQFAFQNAESNPGLAKIVSPSELVVVTSFRVELDTGAGNFHVALPYSMIEPIREILDAGVQSDADNNDERWVDAIKGQVVHAEVNLACVMQEVKVSLNDIIKMNKGDIIPIDMPEKTKLYAEDIPIFEAKFGVHDGRYAVQILNPIQPEEKS